MKSLDRTAHASRPEFDVHLTENVMVPMRDGVRMATDIYRPARWATAAQCFSTVRPTTSWRPEQPRAQTWGLVVRVFST